MLNSNKQRELAYLAKIDDVTPIDGYDRVELAHIGGWTVVVGKGEFLPGDVGVYFEPDSKVPEKAPFTDLPFLAKKNYKIKIQKMCKSISEGLLIAPDAFGFTYDVDNDTFLLNNVVHNLTDDSRFLTKELEVTYSISEDNSRKSDGNKYRSMQDRHKKLFKNPLVKRLMRYEFGRKLMFTFFGKKTDKGFPTHFEYIHKTDEERCLVYNTKISTDKGLLNISDIVNKQLPVKVKSLNSDGTIGYKKIISYQKYNCDNELIEFKFPYRFMTNKSNSLICTSDHKLLTQDGYKKAEYITLNDNLYIKTKTYTDTIIKYLYGNILGDGYLRFDKRSKVPKYHFSFSQGKDHKEYLELLNRLYNGSKIRKEFSGFKKGSVIYKFDIPKLDILNHYLTLDKVFDNNNWHITKEFCDRLTIESLALWYLDDGSSCSFDGSKLIKNPTIATESYSENENNLLVDCLKNKFGYDVKLKKGDYFYITFSRKSGRAFFEAIAEFVPDSMKYKLPEDLRNEHCKLYDEKFELVERTLPVSISSIKKLTNVNKFNNKYVYDIEVEDNHNFFASNIVNHNCENLPYILEDKRHFIATEKLDGTSTTYILERKPFRRFEFYICSRNVRMMSSSQKCYHDHNIYCDMAIKYDIEKHLKNYLKDNPELSYVGLQGESVGSVQGNPLQLKEDDFYGFNFIRSDIGRLSPMEGAAILKDWGMKWVPILTEHWINPDTMEEMKLLADGKSAVNPNVAREGIVYRCVDDNSLSFKNVSREYIMNKKD